MSEEPIDPEAFWEFEHTGWQSSVKQYHESVGRLTRQMIEPLLDATDVNAATNLLDVATGPGYVAAAAARRGSTVTAVDFSSAMVAKARELYPTIQFLEGNAELLLFHHDTFDAVVMNFGLLHLGQPEKAIAEAHRVLRTGGHFGFTVWAKPDETRGFQLVLAAIQDKGDANVLLPPGPPFFRFSDESECERVLVEAGFKTPTISKIKLIWELSSPEELFSAFYYGTARTGGLLRAQSAEALGAIKAEIEKRSEVYRGQHGTLQIPMPALVVATVKP